MSESALTVIVLTNLGRNLGTTEVNSWGLTKGVAGRFIPNLLLGVLKEQPDTNQQLTQTLRIFLSNIANGEDTPLLTQGLQALIGPATRDIVKSRLANMKSFTFLACDDVQERVFELLGAQISQNCYYKMVTATETRYYIFRLTSDGKVTDFISFTE